MVFVENIKDYISVVDNFLIDFLAFEIHAFKDRYQEMRDGSEGESAEKLECLTSLRSLYFLHIADFGVYLKGYKTKPKSYQLEI